MAPSFNQRVLAYGLATFGLAVVVPRLSQGFLPFITSPCGLGVAGLAATVLGSSIEETGTMRRIRLGLDVSLVGMLLLLASAAWGLSFGVPSGGRGVLGLGLLAPGLGGALWLAWRDAKVRRDVRAGQRVYLVRVSARGLELVADGAPMQVPLRALKGATTVASAQARGAAIAVDARDRIAGDAGALTWLSAERDADVFVLTEYQLGCDAEALCRRLHEIVEAGPEGYR